MEFSDENADRKRKIRIIAITCVLAVAILGIGAWVTISAISSIGTTTANNNTTETVAVADAKNEQTPVENNTKTSSASTKKTETAASSTEEKSTSTAASTSASSGNTSSSSNNNTTTKPAETVPSTGPADFIPTALLMGVATYLVLLNRNLAQREIK